MAIVARNAGRVVLQSGIDGEVIGGRWLAAGAIQCRIDEEFHISLEQPPESFEDPTVEIRVVLLVENLPQCRRSDDHADATVRISAKIRCELVESAIAQNDYGFVQSRQNIHALQKILVVDCAAVHQVQCHFHENKRLAGSARFLL
jgi:hypothetical protein